MAVLYLTICWNCYSSAAVSRFYCFMNPPTPRPLILLYLNKSNNSEMISSACRPASSRSTVWHFKTCLWICFWKNYSNSSSIKLCMALCATATDLIFSLFSSIDCIIFSSRSFLAASSCSWSICFYFNFSPSSLTISSSFSYIWVRYLRSWKSLMCSIMAVCKFKPFKSSYILA